MCSEVCFHRSKYIYKIIFSSYALATKIINLKMENKQKDTKVIHLKKTNLRAVKKNSLGNATKCICNIKQI